MLSAIPAALASGHVLAKLGLVLVLAGVGFKIAAVPFHMWVPDTYEAAATPFVAWLAVAPEGRGLHRGVPVVSPRSRQRRPGVGAGSLGDGGSDDRRRQPDGDPQKNVKRMLAYSGIAHIGYMLMGVAAMSADGAGMVLFYLVAYLFSNMGAFLVVQAVGTAEDRI